MKCDLHIHTCYSYDSNAQVKDIVETAIKKGIDCLAITDHGETKGAEEAINYAKGKSILIIPGLEIKSKEGDILGLNIRTIIPNRLSAKETVRRIKEAGGMAIVPHPFAWFCAFTPFRNRRFLTGFKGKLKDFINEIDGIEVLNASIFGPGNKKAFEFSQKFNLAFTCGSDVHFPEFLGKAYLEIPGENLSIEEILKAIKEKRGKIGGQEAGFFEKIIDHSKRNLVKSSKIIKKLC